MLVDYKKANICQTEGENVLDGVDFQVNEGNFIYLIGRVGSGKSSLLKTIYCELDIEEADKAEVLGQSLLEIRRKDIVHEQHSHGVDGAHRSAVHVVGPGAELVALGRHGLEGHHLTIIM